MRKVTVDWGSRFRRLARLNRGIKMKLNFEHGQRFLSIVYILVLCSYNNSNMDSIFICITFCQMTDAFIVGL